MLCTCANALQAMGGSQPRHPQVAFISSWNRHLLDEGFAAVAINPLFLILLDGFHASFNYTRRTQY